VNIQDTSLIAWGEMQGKLAQTQKAVLEILTRTRLTNMELAEALGWSINRVTPRVNELRKKGRLRDCGKRKCSITHRLAYVWTAV